MKINLKSYQVKDIISRYPNEKAQTLADEYNVSLSTIYKTAYRYGVKKSEKFINSPLSGRVQKGNSLSPATQFKKGATHPWKGKRVEMIIKNKKRLQHWREKCLWKKGHKPYNTAKDGEIRWRSNPGYYFIRISERNWIFLHRYMWEKNHGKISIGFNVIFKDGNRRNCKVENLECISNADLAIRNSIHRYPKEIKDTIYAVTSLQKVINKQQQ